VGGVGGGYVGAAVAYEDGLAEVEGEIAGGAEEHSGAGFAVFVVAAVLAEAFGVVGTVVDGVQGDALARQLGAHEVHEVVEVLLGVEAAGYAGLVGDDDQFVAERLGGAAEWDDALYPANVGGEVEVAGFLVDYAVAVEEEGSVFGREIHGVTRDSLSG